MSLEQAFLDRITAEPENALPRQIYADWLEEQGDPRGELLRIQEQLRILDVPDRPAVEARMHQLLKQGVQPLTITRTNSLGMKLVLIFPGQFRMGSPPKEKNRKEDEDQVEVRLTRAFWLGQFVVTQSQWEAVTGTTPWHDELYVKEGDDFPATFVSWEDASEFCQRLNLLDRLSSGWEYALPTEAEWEYACRAGTQSRFGFGDKESLLEQYAWFNQNAWDVNERYAHEVGQKTPNPWRLYDMHGNVWEWCQDWYADSLPAETDPVSPPQDSDRVSRGGSWNNNGRSCLSAHRSGYAPDDRDYYLGFRIALVPPR